jgi:sigma-E factor negative regulatory protein RseA
MDELKSSSNESISALIDGELPTENCAHVIGALLSDAKSMDTWHVYQVVGDVLRSTELAPTTNDLAFWNRLEQRLAIESPRPDDSASVHVTDAMTHSVAAWAATGREGANAPQFRWKVLASVACTSLVAVVGSGIWLQTSPSSDGQLAKVQAIEATKQVVVVTDPVAGTMLRDPRLDELMAAHRQLGGHSALQVPAGFLRNATFEGSSR